MIATSVVIVKCLMSEGVNKGCSLPSNSLVDYVDFDVSVHTTIFFRIPWFGLPRGNFGEARKLSVFDDQETIELRYREV